MWTTSVDGERAGKGERVPDQQTPPAGPSDDLDDAWRFVWSEADAPSRAWLRNTRAEAMHEGTFIISVPNDFTRSRVESRLRPWVEGQLTSYFGRPIGIALVLAPGADDVADDDDFDTTVTAPAPVLTAATHVDDRAGGRLNPKYTFESFVIGSSNRFAHAAAVAVAEAPGKAYNPLMIYGESGLGKTHLLHALGHYVRNYHASRRVKYVSTEELTNDFINAISDNRALAEIAIAPAASKPNAARCFHNSQAPSAPNTMSLAVRPPGDLRSSWSAGIESRPPASASSTACGCSTPPSSSSTNPKAATFRTAVARNGRPSIFPVRAFSTSTRNCPTPPARCLS